MYGYSTLYDFELINGKRVDKNSKDYDYGDHKANEKAKDQEA